ncbi:phosphate acyltransferase [Ereboglobus luteus]|uniref:Phosphate acetyltransferase n=1 Tax=Ereboglobus luteus TaxID=1796921 RepID=A0A2U8E7J4_9BACT|nr:phosphate acyltransferase [Ereboglobus luteus]AWI10582.1 phosphate acetyltransferase [Ereboglobus luteus]
MPIIPKLAAKLQRHPKRVVFAEGNDPRILQAARQWVTRRMGAPILLGDRTLIKNSAMRLDINLQGMRIIDPAQSEEFEPFALQFAELRRSRDKEISLDEARDTMRDTSYFATMMLANAQADCLVGGATRVASSALRPLFQIIPKHEHAQNVASLMIIAFDEHKVGSDGTLFFADCGVIPEPTAEQLADIAVSTAQIAYHITNETPRIAMLSWATHSDASHPSIVRVRRATQLARVKAIEAGLTVEIEGEIQADAALDALTAQTKKIGGPVAGRANVLIFPDLASGNIAFKLVNILGGSYAYGQILTGLSRPAAEISRGSSAHDVYGAAVIVGCQAIDHKLLYGT